MAKFAKSKTPTLDAVAKYLEQNAPDLYEKIRKDMTVADVHKPSAGGDKKVSALADAARAKMKNGDNSVDKVQWSASVQVTKVNVDKQMIFGWASVTEIDGQPVVDKQDDVIKTEDLEEGAYDFVLYSRTHGDMHVKKGTGRMIESMVFTPDKAEKGLIALDPDTGKQLYGWFTGWKIDEPKVWDAYKRGERPELSIGGQGTRVPL